MRPNVNKTGAKMADANDGIRGETGVRGTNWHERKEDFFLTCGEVDDGHNGTRKA